MELIYTPQLSNNWAKAWYEISKKYPFMLERIGHSFNTSQVQSKLWLAEELIKINSNFNQVALLGGWFAHILSALLFDKLDVNYITNYEIDEVVKQISYKFNTRYNTGDVTKYKAKRKNVMMELIRKDNKYPFDLIVNTSCEHMFPMHKIVNYYSKKKWLDTLFVIQSTNDDQYDDHINCVEDEYELAEQANFMDIYFTGKKLLDNGMTRFMVIGR